MSSKNTCPHCNKSFVNVALHITKAHDAWVAERMSNRVWRKSYNFKTKKQEEMWCEDKIHWVLTKNGEKVCELWDAQGTISWGGDNTTYSDWHGDSDCKYILLCDYDGDHAKTKIIYSHYKGNTAWGISKTVVCDNLTVIA